jgi:hypothetical protein
LSTLRVRFEEFDNVTHSKHEELRWKIGRNIRIDYRWGIVDAEKIQAATVELLALAPDVIIASTSRAVATLQ